MHEFFRCSNRSKAPIRNLEKFLPSRERSHIPLKGSRWKNDFPAFPWDMLQLPGGGTPKFEPQKRDCFFTQKIKMLGFEGRFVQGQGVTSSGVIQTSGGPQTR